MPGDRTAAGNSGERYTHQTFARTPRRTVAHRKHAGGELRLFGFGKLEQFR